MAGAIAEAGAAEEAALIASRSGRDHMRRFRSEVEALRWLYT